MALRSTTDDKIGDSIAFWESIASEFKENEYVFYELYNEPHLQSETDNDIYLYGDDTYVGMIEMIEAVRKHSKD